MKCTICVVQIDPVEEGIDQGGGPQNLGGRGRKCSYHCNWIELCPAFPAHCENMK